MRCITRIIKKGEKIPLIRSNIPLFIQNCQMLIKDVYFDNSIDKTHLSIWELKNKSWDYLCLNNIIYLYNFEQNLFLQGKMVNGQYLFNAKAFFM